MYSMVAQLSHVLLVMLLVSGLFILPVTNKVSRLSKEDLCLPLSIANFTARSNSRSNGVSAYLAVIGSLGSREVAKFITYAPNLLGIGR